MKEGIALMPSEKEYLLPHFMMLIIGRPGSGKTSLIRQMLTNPLMYMGKFDDILLVSPSYAKMGLAIKDENCTGLFSLRWIYEKLEKFNTDQLIAHKKALMKKAGLSDLDMFMDELQNPTVERLNEQKMKKLNNTGFPSKTPLGAAPEIIKQNLELTERMYNGQSKFFGNKQSFPIPTGQMTKSTLSIFSRHNKGKLKLHNGVDPASIPTDVLENIKKERDKVNQKQLQQLTDEEKRQFYKNVLLIMDDVVGDLKTNEHNPDLAKLILNRRHLIHNGMVSIIIVSQKFTLIPSRIRSNANWLVAFKVNPIDNENIYRDLVALHRKQWEQLIYMIFDAKSEDEDEVMNLETIMQQKRFDTIGIWVEFDVFFKNFKRVII